MQPVVFSAAWFAQHQATLLWLLNTPVIGRWFKWVLCIRRHDVGYERDIVALYPHAYTVANADGTLTTDFRTHAKYAKRLYYAFRPVWWALHAWDALIANPFVPALNAGFDSLTAYPNPSPGVTSCDGWIRQFDVGTYTWASLVALTAGSEAVVTDSDFYLIFIGGDQTTNAWARLQRAFFLFDTSTIGSGVASAATLSIYGGTFGGGGGKADNRSIAPNVDIYTSSPASNTTLVTGDFDQVGSTSLTTGAVSYAAWTAGAYNDFTLNASGLAAIATTGITKLAARNGNYDAAGTAPTAAFGDIGAYLTGVYANNTGTSADPKLVVTYTVPSFALITLLGTTP